MEETEEDTSQSSHVHGKEEDIVKTSVHAAKRDLQINYKPHRNPNKILLKTRKINSRIPMELSRTIPDYPEQCLMHKVIMAVPQCSVSPPLCTAVP